jgi:hypothetical protein
MGREAIARAIIAAHRKGEYLALFPLCLNGNAFFSNMLALASFPCFENLVAYDG